VVADKISFDCRRDDGNVFSPKGSCIGKTPSSPSSPFKTVDELRVTAVIDTKSSTSESRT
jgi:hypothetical protein